MSAQGLSVPSPSLSCASREFAAAPSAHGRAVGLYFGLLTFATAAAITLLPHMSANWAMADWLMNYQGGFLRRGLPGQVALTLSHVLHLPVAIFPVLFCMVLYGVLLVGGRALAAQAVLTPWNLALILSPATFAFQLLDLSNAGKKEILYLAALTGLLLLLRRGTPRVGTLVAYLSAVTVVATLSHESASMFTPYFFAALVLAGRSAKQAAKVCALPVALGFAVTLLCAAHPGNLRVEQRVCASLGQTVSADPSPALLCGANGAMSYLAMTPAEAREQVRVLAARDHFLPFYGLLALLALVPVVGSSLELRADLPARRLRWLWASFICSVLMSLPLFFFALDWGRWIYIHVMSLALLLLFASGEAPVARLPARRIGPFLAVLLALYAGGWTLPDTGGAHAEQRFGYVDVVRDFVTRLHRHL